MDSGCYVGSVFFDLRKAFDRVWHSVLLSKLKAAGVAGAAFQWFTNFLSKAVNGSVSLFSSLHDGVPQGAILSPLLFSV